MQKHLQFANGARSHLASKVIGAVYALALLGCLPLSGQSWTPFIDPSRAIDWSTAGFSIPNYTVNCAVQPSLTAGSSGSIPANNTTAIQNSINSCDATHNVVNIPSGTWHIASLDFQSKSKVVVRGAGANSTYIFNTTDVSGGCNGFSNFGVCMGANTGVYWGSGTVAPGTGSQQCSWSANYAQGATSITLSGCGSTPPASTMLFLDQNNDAADTGGVYICDSQTTGCTNLTGGGNEDGRCVRDGGGNCTPPTRSEIQPVFATITATGGGSYTATLSHGVYFNNIRSGQSPGAWWTGYSQNLGIENLTFDQSLNGFGIAMWNCYQCWVKGVRSLYGGRNHIAVYESLDSVVRDNYFYSSQTPGTSQSYGIEVDHGVSGLLTENNIFQQTTVPIIFDAGAGNVVAYNYSIDNIQSGAGMQVAIYTHNAGSEFNLWEGNAFNGINADSTTWGASTNGTLYRNNLTGWQLGKSQYTYAVSLESWSRAFNVIGNVLGQPGYDITYESYATSTTSGVNGGDAVLTSIYALGWTGYNGWGGCGKEIGGTPCGPLVRPTLMRWGNWDVVNNAAQWNATEASPAAIPFVNANFTSGYFGSLAHTLPASLHYSSTPSWWPSGKNWPPIGPDVTTGNVGTCSGTYNGSQGTLSSQCTGGTLSAAWASHVTSLPAQDCFLSVMHGPPDGSGSVLNFSASACYAAAPATFTLSTATTGTGSGTITGCAGNYAFGDPFTCSVTPASGSTISGVTGCGGSGTSTYAGAMPASNCIVTATFQGTVATPTFAQVGQRVTIATSTTGATIHYTTDGTTPTTSSPVYASPLFVAKTQTLKALANKASWTNSAVGSQSYTVSAQQMQMYISGNSATDVPNPFPAVNRSIATEWKDVLSTPATDCNTYNWAPLTSWLSASTSHGAVNMYTFSHVPQCANGTTNFGNPPTDIATGDTFFKNFVTAFMKHICGVSSPPGSPLPYTSCSNMQYIELWNEANVGKYWTGTAAQMATMWNDAIPIIHTYCKDCIIVGGSTSAGGKGNDYYYAFLLSVYQNLTQYPDSASFHPYPSRTNVEPVPFPTTLVSHSSATCTSGNTPNVSCDVAIKDEVSYFQTHVLNDASVIAWAGKFPVYLSEGAYGINDGVCDGADCDEASSTLFHAQPTPAFLRAAYASQWMLALAAQNPAWTMWYSDKDQCWGTVTWNGTSPGSGCPNTPAATIATSYTQQALTLTNFWLGNHAITGSLTSTAITGGNKWTLPLDSGAAEIAFCDAWLADCTTSTSFNSATDITGATSSLSGTVTLTQEPLLLFTSGVVANPTFSPSPGAFGPAQTVTLADATTGATICYTTDGSTPTSGPVGTCSHGTTYSGAILVAATTTIKAIGTKASNADSAVVSGTYTINGAASTPTFSPVAGTYIGTQSVTLSDSTSGAVIHYTVDGSTPTGASPTYSGAISVAVNTTVKAIAIASGYVNSAVGTATYTIVPPSSVTVTLTGTQSFSGASKIQ